MQWGFPQKENGMYLLNREDVGSIADQVLREYSPENLSYPAPLDIEGLLEKLGLMIKRTYLGFPGRDILGATVMGDMDVVPEYSGITMQVEMVEETYGTVLINLALNGKENLGRKRYTEAHEASHWLLHGDYFKKSDSGQLIACRSVERYRWAKQRTENDWLEWQADTLAAELLMPRQPFREYARHALEYAGAQRGYLIEGNSLDRRIFNTAIDLITKQFRVSRRAAEIRMIHLGLIKRISI